MTRRLLRILAIIPFVLSIILTGVYLVLLSWVVWILTGKWYDEIIKEAVVYKLANFIFE